MKSLNSITILKYLLHPFTIFKHFIAHPVTMIKIFIELIIKAPLPKREKIYPFAFPRNPSNPYSTEFWVNKI